MTTSVLTPTSGIRQQRVEFIRESNFGTTPSDPSWNRFSDDVISYEPTMDANVEPVRSLGNALPSDHAGGVESHELAVAYRLQKDFLDGSSNPKDASADGMERDSDNILKNSHTVVKRDIKTEKDGNTVRTYKVGKGGYIDTVEASLDIGDSDFIIFNLNYMFRKKRSYRIEQPSSDTKLALESTDSSDTGITVTIENEGATTTEDVSLDGSDATTLVSTTSSFGDIDAIELGSETVGDVKVYENDGSETSPTKGTKLTTIQGSDSYDGVQGDLGVPALGSGSHVTSDIGTQYYRFANSTVERPSSTDLAAQINTVDFTVENNIEAQGEVGSTLPQLVPGVQEVTLTSTIWGEKEIHDKLVDHLTIAKDDLVWDLNSGSTSPGKITLGNSTITDPGSTAEESEQAIASVDVQFSAESLTVSSS